MRFNSLDDVWSLIRDKSEETVTLEYKSEIGDKRLIQSICAFANTEGGTIICGIEEKGRIPVSVKWLRGAGTEEQIQNIVKTLIHPTLDDVKIRPLPNPANNAEAVFVVDVPRSFQGPHMVHNKYYSRRGSVSSPMEDIEVRAAMFSTGRASALRHEVFENSKLARQTCKLIDQVYDKQPEERQPMALVPLHTDAWRTVVSSGLVYSLGSDLAERLLEVYRIIHEVNSLIARANEADTHSKLIVHTPVFPDSVKHGVYLLYVLRDKLSRLVGPMEEIAAMLPH